jgi:hypothetical protein
MKTILIILASTMLSSAIHFSNIAVADDKQKNDKEQVGRFQLHLVKQGDDHILYRIDSVTGNVSVYDPNEKTVMTPEDSKNMSPQIQNRIKDYYNSGKMVFQTPFWHPISEKLNGITISEK